MATRELSSLDRGSLSLEQRGRSPLGPCSPSSSNIVINDNKLTTRYDYTTSYLSPNVETQCDQAFKNIDAALKEAGAEMKDVVRVHYFLPDRDDFKKCWPILRRWWGEIKPAATMAQVGLMKEEMKIEIEVTAHVLG